MVPTDRASGLCFSLLLVSVIGYTSAQVHLEIVGDEKVCHGTSNGLVRQGDSEDRYALYKHLYTNCTYLLGNLEIVFLDTPYKIFDLSFLSTIKQVTGYVLIMNVHAYHVPLTSLQVIRGKTLFRYPKLSDQYSLFVALNYDKNSELGLKELRFSSLREILAGKIFFMNNNDLCLEKSIDWEDINPHVYFPVTFMSNSTDHGRPCDSVECHPSCYSPVTNTRHCWGTGEGMCQKLTHREACPTPCQHRCSDDLPQVCCHEECAGGCSGPLETDCLACRNYLYGGACVRACQLQNIYDKSIDENIPNPNATYYYGGICVEECPAYRLQDDGACVVKCPTGKHARDGKTCVVCHGLCPRACNGTGSTHLTALNLHTFVNCTVIDGNMKIIPATFEGDPYYNISSLHPTNLTVLKHVREITGYLLIQSKHEDFTDLSFLSSLEVIYGRRLIRDQQALQILQTPLKTLELAALRRIANGDVFIAGNYQLCYADTVNWTLLFDTERQTTLVTANKQTTNCESEGEVCDPQCTTEGCWGKGPTNCLKCLMYEFEAEHLCLSNCTDQPLLYHSGDGKCKRCHEECANSCTGPGTVQCDSCANVAIPGPTANNCSQSCPGLMYSDRDRVCRPCHPHCAFHGCTGPSPEMREGGCNYCDLGKKEGNTITCVPADQGCQPGYNMVPERIAFSSVTSRQPQLCEACHELCLTCTGPGSRFCETCKHIRLLDGYCGDVCPGSTYSDWDRKECQPCHPQCRGGCTGPSSDLCVACSNFKIFLDEDLIKFNCTPECPPSQPYRVRDSTQKDDNLIVCADESHPDVLKKDEEKRQTVIVVGTVTGGLILLGILLAVFGYLCHRRARSKQKTAELTAVINDFGETEPLSPTTAPPDLSKMRLIKESELLKGAVIGSGAFGTVYKGFWIPEGENVKIPVAIKVLKDGASANQNKELLEEARVMASVENPCCIRILAVCMSAQMMLITQLMPLGCLLDYVRKNKDHIGSKALLNWCTQIARGMAYLEERGIVHRDLAARNVLLKSPTLIKITDFGLAKLLDYNKEEYQAARELMPVKWVALECIKYRIFTHKSDVWSYGVTVWELLTYGEKPYRKRNVRDMLQLLENGERLPQPSICTIDVYMMMLRCWLLDPMSRPSFKELADDFSSMARDPGRYLVIQGDELMKLPSHSYDTNELAHSITMEADGSMEMTDGPTEIVDADRYIQAHNLRLSTQQEDLENSTSASPLLLPRDTHDLPSKEELGEPGHDPPLQRKSSLDTAAEVRERGQRGVPAADSSSFVQETDKETPGVSSPQPHAHQGPVLLHQQDNSVTDGPPSPKPTPLQLPLDEDNYLAPLSSTTTAMYTDLSDAGYYQNEVFDDAPEQQGKEALLGSGVGSKTSAMDYSDSTGSPEVNRDDEMCTLAQTLAFIDSESDL